MKLKYNPQMTFEKMIEVLTRALPGYKIELRKNPLMRFNYIVIRKSAFIGVWVRVFEQKGFVQLIKAIPSVWARAFFGSLLVILLMSKSQGKVADEVAQVLEREFGTARV